MHLCVLTGCPAPLGVLPDGRQVARLLAEPGTKNRAPCPPALRRPRGQVGGQSPVEKACGDRDQREGRPGVPGRQAGGERPGTPARVSGAFFEDIADSPDGMNQLLGKRIVHLGAEPSHVNVDHVAVADEADVPDLLGNLGPGQHLTRSAGQQGQKGKLLGRQLESLAVARQPAGEPGPAPGRQCARRPAVAPPRAATAIGRGPAAR